jgi:hypothetical protein
VYSLVSEVKVPEGVLLLGAETAVEGALLKLEVELFVVLDQLDRCLEDLVLADLLAAQLHEKLLVHDYPSLYTVLVLEALLYLFPPDPAQLDVQLQGLEDAESHVLVADLQLLPLQVRVRVQRQTDQQTLVQGRDQVLELLYLLP